MSTAYRAQIARQVITRVSVCEFPWKDHCEFCANTLVGRTDGMRAIIVTRTVRGSKKASATIICEPCAVARNFIPRGN